MQFKTWLVCLCTGQWHRLWSAWGTWGTPVCTQPAALTQVPSHQGSLKKQEQCFHNKLGKLSHNGVLASSGKHFLNHYITFKSHVSLPANFNSGFMDHVFNKYKLHHVETTTTPNTMTLDFPFPSSCSLTTILNMQVTFRGQSILRSQKYLTDCVCFKTVWPMETFAF
jgi:hypothetical protein